MWGPHFRFIPLYFVSPLEVFNALHFCSAFHAPVPFNRFLFLLSFCCSCWCCCCCCPAAAPAARPCSWCRLALRIPLSRALLILICSFLSFREHKRRISRVRLLYIDNVWIVSHTTNSVLFKSLALDDECFHLAHVLSPLFNFSFLPIRCSFTLTWHSNKLCLKIYSCNPNSSRAHSGRHITLFTCRTYCYPVYMLLQRRSSERKRDMWGASTLRSESNCWHFVRESFKCPFYCYRR